MNTTGGKADPLPDSNLNLATMWFNFLDILINFEECLPRQIDLVNVNKKDAKNPAATTPLSQMKSGRQEADRKSSLQKEQLLRRVGQMKGDEQYRSGSRGRMAGGVREAELLENKNEPGGHQDL
ncbi:Uncharacterized protein DAT39_005553 [Clarias magur]|uniref:Uncharacterized protein n=1 Tax=Clarias magur TaxID=1594786 RepID=A0A8J4USK0_CLAMG|nr:Uncharacterized protein DAT39_005553 [Clarias magur]